MAPAPALVIRRGFADTPDGQVHYREAGPGPAAAGAVAPPPLVMLHPSPGSARMLEPLIGALAAGRRVVATDTLGNGDSAPPPGAGADVPLPRFAEAHLAALDALGIARFDLYGSHTGANIACEIAIRHPGRVRRLILDGISLYTAEERADMLANYALPVRPDLHGSQFNFVWHFVRDVFLFWPWYKRDAAHRRAIGLPDAESLHDKVVEVLKAARTYHIPYRAALGYEKEARLPLVAVPTLLACARTDMFMEYLDRVAALMPQAERAVTEGTGSAAALAATAALFAAFLDRAG